MRALRARRADDGCIEPAAQHSHLHLQIPCLSLVTRLAIARWSRDAPAHTLPTPRKRTVALLSGQSVAYRNVFFINAVLWGLSNLVRCALDAGVSASALSSDESSTPALVVAALIGSVRILKQLLEAGADHGLKDRSGCSALHAAAQEGHLDCIELLLAAGADANMSNDVGDTLLMCAIVKKHTDCARALLCASDLHITNRSGYTALHACIMTGSEECFDLMLPHVSDVDAERTLRGVHAANGEPILVSNCSPLHLACSGGQHRMAKALLKRGADRMARNSRQGTPLMYTAHNGHLACAVLLLGQTGKIKMTPAAVKTADERGFTALHIASQQGHVKICGVLLEAGARLDLKSSDGSTPLMCALHFHPSNAPLLALLSGGGPAQPPGTVCDHCGKTAAQASVKALKACSQCQAVRYCGVECSVSAWPGHKAACKARAAEREAATKPMIFT